MGFLLQAKLTQHYQLSRHTAPLEALEDEILAAGGEAFTVSADISDPSAVQAMAMEIGVTYGRVDIIINNAAVAILILLREALPNICYTDR